MSDSAAPPDPSAVNVPPTGLAPAEAAPAKPLTSRQPAKALYLLYEALTTLGLRLPFWTALALVPALRPRRKWSVARCVRMRLLSHALLVTSKTGELHKYPTHMKLEPDADGVWLAPLPASDILPPISEYAAKAGVSPVRIPGYWISAPGQPAVGLDARAEPGETVLLFLHGGAYVTISAHPGQLTSGIPRAVLHCVPGARRALNVEYRLSAPAKSDAQGGANPFPAALLDALAGYVHLVRVLGFEPKNVVVVGDSAGGNLALALVRYLVQNADALAAAAVPDADDSKRGAPGVPGALVLLSPWVDLGTSHAEQEKRKPWLRQTDYIGNHDPRAPRTRSPNAALCGPHGLSLADDEAYVSPGSAHAGVDASFVGFPRTFLVAGGAEWLFASIGTLRQKLARDIGDNLGYYEAPDGVHDFVAFGWHEPERGEALRRIGEWFEETAEP